MAGLVVACAALASASGGIGARAAAVANVEHAEGHAPFTGVAVSEVGAQATDPARFRAEDGRDGTVSVTGGRTGTGESWLVGVHVSGGPFEGIRLVSAAGPLSVGATGVVAWVNVDGSVCRNHGPVVIREYALGADGTLTRLAADVSGTCADSVAGVELALKAQVRLAATTPYGGLDLPGAELDLGAVPTGLVSTPVTQVVRYVGAGSARLGSVSVDPMTTETGADADFRVDADTCTGMVLRAGQHCEVRPRVRLRADRTTWSRLRLRSPDGTVLAQKAVTLTPEHAGGSGTVMPALDRLLDTRGYYGNRAPAPVPPGGVVAVDVAAFFGAPGRSAGGSALVNLTVVNPSAAGYLSALAPGATTSATSSVNFAAGPPTSDLVVAPVDPAGLVRILNSSPRPVDIVVDLEGVVQSQDDCEPQLCGLRLHPTVPSRVLDTRTAAGGGHPLAVGTTNLTLQLPHYTDGTLAVLATVTAVSPQASGWLRIGRRQQSSGPITDLTYPQGRTTSNTVLASVEDLSTGSLLAITNFGRPVHVVLDVVAVLDHGGDPNGVVLSPPSGVDPVRIADSRHGLGLTTLSGGTAQTVNVPSALRDADTWGVLQGLVAIPSSPTLLAAYPTETTRPPISSMLATNPPNPTSTTVLTWLAPSGSFDIYADQGPTDVVSDLVAVARLYPSTAALDGFDRVPDPLQVVAPGTLGP